MKRKFQETVRKRKQEIDERLEYVPESSPVPVFDPGTIVYEVSEKAQATPHGGVGILVQLMRRLDLPKRLNRLDLLKIHLPYHESDHIQNLMLNFACGGDCLEDIEMLRKDAAYLDALGTRRIPDPTTAGDFLRRFSYAQNVQLLDIMNETNAEAWTRAGTFGRTAILDIDSKIEQSYGECKQGIDMSYKGKWGFHPLVVTEAGTGSHVCVINRSGNVVSQDDAPNWLNYSIAKTRPYFASVLLRGDSAFSLTGEFDHWDREGVGFCFGLDRTQDRAKMADSLPRGAWVELEAPVISRSKTLPKKRRHKRERIKARGYQHLETIKEHVAEFAYRPGKCSRDYRVIAVRKTIKVTQGQLRLDDEMRYLFYITNIMEPSPAQMVEFIHDRCNHENRLQQLSAGVPAFGAPTAEFPANWAFMVIGAMAWNLKSWFGLLFADKTKGDELLRMEYKRFVRSIISMPCQILRTGRRTVFRLLWMNSWTEALYLTFCGLKKIPSSA